ncbi:helix-turn-helix transcriptional regulator [Neobacillus mesonae]|uniref:helix-turn-helix domain-containing protein n=1 Tax=Neobacillus mesonae TaxID=1193713 RepID=UPI00203CCD4A|nr:helix-turn-helix transcriptional regulator [Neobacillus mesonae]MCM3567543.1 helix-turn-helix domain-containing protein [Neobacillus mesonae]
MREFGEELRQLRKEKGLSIRKLSELSGVAHSYLSQVETGKRGIPKVETLEKIAAGLNIPLPDLLEMAGYLPTEIVEDMQYEKLEHNPSGYDLYYLLKNSEHLKIYFKKKPLTKDLQIAVANILEPIVEELLKRK